MHHSCIAYLLIGWGFMDLVQDLKGKTALVTGSTDGLGMLAAKKLLQRGAHVTINGRNPERGQKALQQLKHEAASEAVSFIAGDCVSYETAEKVTAHAAQATGRLDILVSAGAAGSVKPMPFAEMSGDELFKSFNSRFFARINPVHAAIPYMKEHGGAVVMIGTDAARHPTPGESMIGAYGAGVILLTKTLANEFSRWKLRVNAVAMTITTDTTSWDRVFSEQTFQTHLFNKAVSRFPYGRPPNATEVANVITFLATDDSAQVTGQTISVNGGLSFGGW